MSNVANVGVRVIHCVRPRGAYQVIRWVEGGKMMLTCTRRGEISFWDLRVEGDTERPYRMADSDRESAIERARRYGYDLPQICAKLKTLAKAK